MKKNSEDPLSHHQPLPIMTEDTICYPEHGFYFHDALTLVLRIVMTYKSLSVTSSAVFTTIKSEQIGLPKKVYPPHPSSESHEWNPIGSSSYKCHLLPRLEASHFGRLEVTFLKKEISCLFMSRHTHRFSSRI
jgi:hypothetical protein